MAFILRGKALKNAFYVFLILVLLGGGWIIWKKFRVNQIETKAFGGILVKMENNTLYVNGIYVPDNPELVKGGEIKMMEIRATLLPDTIITKELMYLPSIEQLAGNKGRYSTKDLEKEITKADADTLAQDAEKYPLTVYLKTNSNVFGKKNFQITEVKYSLPPQHKVRPSGQNIINETPVYTPPTQP